jgi:hypothetical protein
LRRKPTSRWEIEVSNDGRIDHRFMWKLFQQIPFVSPNDGGGGANIYKQFVGFGWVGAPDLTAAQRACPLLPTLRVRQWDEETHTRCCWTMRRAAPAKGAFGVRCWTGAARLRKTDHGIVRDQETVPLRR